MLFGQPGYGQGTYNTVDVNLQPQPTQYGHWRDYPETAVGHIRMSLPRQLLKMWGLPMSKNTRVIAFYLPQYHPIPENDNWWGKGFTEWTNTAKAKRLFPGHYQPHVPADLGFYDLRLPEARLAQADMAKHYGIDAFCYYHYWFGGKQLLERPFEEVLRSGKPDFGFCLCWANETWSGIWHGAPNKILIEQTYPGENDHRKHFEYLLPAFRDERYLRVDEKPIFIIYRPLKLTSTRLWQTMAKEAGLKGLHLIGVNESDDWCPADHGYDASITPKLPPRDSWVSWRNPLKKVKKILGWPSVHLYKDVILGLLSNPLYGVENYPCVIPNWDNTPRSGKNGLVLHKSNPELFRLQLREALARSKNLQEGHRLVFVKSWNEWAEGNHLEPDLRYGDAYLKVVRDELMRINCE